MAGTERVVNALGAAGEAGKAVLLAQRADAVAPAGQHLVRVGLMADVPDQAIVGGVEHGMKRHCELDHAETGTKVSAGHRDGVDHLRAQFVGDLAQLRAVERPQIGWRLDGVEQRSQRPVRQGRSPEAGYVALV